EDVAALAAWKPRAERTEEVPFIVARVLLQDFTGVPLIVDLGAMRSAVARAGSDPKRIEPVVPVDLVIDHSVQVDAFGRADAFDLNLQMEFKRNRPRYEFLKWGMGAFDGLRIVPPGIGICHQVNLEYLARGVLSRDGVWFPDSLVGTDSHTTMINGLGIVGWGVGGIEAEAGMLGQPVYFLMPDVVGVHVSGALKEGVTATDLVLHVTEMLRKAKVVGKFVEFHGEGAATLPAPTRATIANMAPEYGATMGFFPVDERSCEYLAATGRPPALVEEVRRYFGAQGLFGIPRKGEVDYSQTVELDLGAVAPAVSGPKRPQDRIDLGKLKQRFLDLLAAPPPDGYGKPDHGSAERVRVLIGNHDGPCELARSGGEQDPGTSPTGRTRNTNPLTEIEMMNNRPTANPVAVDEYASAGVRIGHGSVLIAAITSCTNTSNPGVMLAAGLLAKKAVERGLRVPAYVKTSLAPGSRVVTDYLAKTGLQRYLDQLGFQLVGYGCTTCIGNSGPLDPCLDEAIARHDLVVASVLSGNRNFEARVHQAVKANFLMSPPLVVAFALAGRVDVDLAREPIGIARDGKEVFLRELWPTPAELEAVMGAAVDPEAYRRLYADLASATPLWTKVPSPTGVTYAWDPASTYVREPPYFEVFTMTAPPRAAIRGARALAIFGDSVTTDHISPAGAITPGSPAGRYLVSLGVAVEDFNSYGSRRGNHEVMVRGTFANVRIKNLMLGGKEGGDTLHQPGGERMSIFDAAERYAKEGVPLVVFAGQEYGTGSSRDWAAKGPQLLGVRAVVARSFERIHRSNLVFMGVLPCELPEGVTAQTLKLDGTETFEVAGLEGGVRPRMALTLRIARASGAVEEVKVTARIDTPI
ncbi:MAG TPA: aconitate hydratase, partial [Planctomycetota bacterium]|nr:aconitate hydratase [Planctomycetota bacterium]